MGATDIIVDYYHAIQTGLDVMPGQFGATYAIPIIYVPLLMITHVVAFYFLLRPNVRSSELRFFVEDNYDRYHHQSTRTL